MNNEIPKHLRHLLLKRGGTEKIKRELTARNSMLERPNLVYSTQEAAPRINEAAKNRGCIPCSTAIKTRSFEEGATSGRTNFWSWNDGSISCGQRPSARVFGERRR